MNWPSGMVGRGLTDPPSGENRLLKSTGGIKILLNAAPLSSEGQLEAAKVVLMICSGAKSTKKVFLL